MEIPVLSYFTVLKSKMFQDVQQLFFISIIVGFIASILVEAIKESEGTIFLKDEANKNVIFITNAILNLFISITIVLAFDGLTTWILTLFYILLITILSFALSIVCYKYFIRYLFRLFDVMGTAIDLLDAKLKNKIENLKPKT